MFVGGAWSAIQNSLSVNRKKNRLVIVNFEGSDATRQKGEFGRQDVKINCAPPTLTEANYSIGKVEKLTFYNLNR